MSPEKALGIWICRCRCILESSGSQNSGCTQYILEASNQRVQMVMSQRSAGSCTCCTRANAFPALRFEQTNASKADVLQAPACKSLKKYFSQLSPNWSDLCNIMKQFHQHYLFRVQSFFNIFSSFFFNFFDQILNCAIQFKSKGHPK